jgi:bla regulator protein blaR1
VTNRAYFVSPQRARSCRASLWAVVATLMVFASGSLAQSATSEHGPKFEVASIKPSDPSVNGFRIQSAPGGRFIASGVTVKFLIQQAYGVRDFQISGGPSWIDTLKFDLNAKADDETANQRDVMSLRMQALLEERFQLKLTHETRELPIYELVVAKGGPRLKESTVGDEGRNMRLGRGRMVVQGAGPPMLATQLSQTLGRTVVNKTGLTGSYDFTLEWTPDGQPLGPKDGDAPSSVESSGPTIFTALQEQLGLKLESTKGPVEVLVIGRVEKPTEN